MSYAEYQSLCEKAYARMIEKGLMLIGWDSKEGYFVDCTVVNEKEKERYMWDGTAHVLSRDEIMKDDGAQEALLVFGLRDAWDNRQK